MERYNIFLIFFFVTICQAEEFDTDFLVGKAGKHSFSDSDLAGFKDGNFTVDVNVNGKFVGEKSIRIVKMDKALKSCMTRDTLHSLGITSDSALSGACHFLTEWVQGASESYDETSHSLNLSIPDKQIVKNDRYKVSPVRWDYGESMFYTNYSASMNASESAGGNRFNSAYLDFDNGFNVKSWQFHNRTTAVSAQNVTKTYVRDLYVEKPLPQKQIVFKGGRSFFSSEGLDSFAYKGVRVSSDDSMLNQTLIKYAPKVEGVISSQAKIVILQQNNIIYQGVFPPGKYSISELNLLNEYDSITVYVNEAGKPPYRYFLPVHSASGLLKPGRKKWSLTGGVTDLNDNYYRSAAFTAIGYKKGISNAFSLRSGGLLLSNRYAVLTSGGDFFTDAGLFSGSLSFARQEAGNGNSKCGIVVSSSYNKNIESMKINISSGLTRYSRSGITGMEGTLARQKTSPVIERFFSPVVRNEFDFNLSKALEKSDISVRLSMMDYYRSSENDVRYGAHYQHFFYGWSMNVSVSRTLSYSGPGELTYDLSVAVPLTFGQKKYYSDSGITASRQAAKFHSSVSSTFGSDERDSFNVYTGREIYGKSYDNQEFGGSVGFDSMYNNTSLGMSKSATFRQFSASSTGSVILHNQGITLGKSVGKSFALVNAPGAAGAKIDNGSSVIDSNGYGIVPSVTPYAENLINLSPGSMNSDVELPVTSKSVVPVSGAMLKIRYRTITGVPVLVKIQNRDMPAGLTVRDADGTAVGMTGQSSLIYLRQSSEEHRYSVSPDDISHNRCNFRIAISPAELHKKFLKREVVCDP